MASSANGLNRSLTEAQSYALEARRSEDLANRLEHQATWYEGANASGSLNLSQAYREWGMAEIEANRDYYGPVRFDDIGFQMSPKGQQLQAKFVTTYADRLHDQIEGDLALPASAPVARPGVAGFGDIRSQGTRDTRRPGAAILELIQRGLARRFARRSRTAKPVSISRAAISTPLLAAQRAQARMRLTE